MKYQIELLIAELLPPRRTPSGKTTPAKISGSDGVEYAVQSLDGLAPGMMIQATCEESVNPSNPKYVNKRLVNIEVVSAAAAPQYAPQPAPPVYAPQQPAVHAGALPSHPAPAPAPAQPAPMAALAALAPQQIPYAQMVSIRGYLVKDAMAFISALNASLLVGAEPIGIDRLPGALNQLLPVLESLVLHGQFDPFGDQ